MPTKPKPASNRKPTVVALRAPVAFGGKEVEVDEVAGIIRNCALMTIGPTLGHPFSVDQTTIQQVHDLIAAQPDGVPTRFKHPRVEEEAGRFVMEDALGAQVGRVKNPRIVGNSVRGDIHLGDYAASLPAIGGGDARTYLLKIAKEDPASIGLSAVIEYDVEPQLDSNGRPKSSLPPARVSGVQAVDFVGTPAANPNGLLSAAPTQRGHQILGVLKVRPHTFDELSALFGVPPHDLAEHAARLFAAGHARLVGPYLTAIPSHS